MVWVTHFVMSLFLVVSLLLGISSGFSISKRDSKISPQSSLVSSSTSENPKRKNDSTKTEILADTAVDHQPSSAAAAHNVPFDIVPGSSSSDSKIISVVKREASSTTTGSESGNGYDLYDPNLMIISKRSAAALNKLMLALRSYDDPPSSSSYEHSVEGSNKETSSRFPKVGFRTSSGSGLAYDQISQNGLQRRGPASSAQQNRKHYMKCFFNAVSCFRRRK